MVHPQDSPAASPDAVPDRDFQTRDQRHIQNLMGTIRQENDHFPTWGRKPDEILVLHKNAAAVSGVDDKRLERLRGQQFPDFGDLHAKAT